MMQILFWAGVAFFMYVVVFPVLFTIAYYV